MASLVRQKYGRLVRQGAWEKSKTHFQWVPPLLFGALVFVITGLAIGFDEARKNLVPRLFIGGATVVSGFAIYAYNLFRSASDIYVEQLAAVARIEKMKDTEVAAANAKHAEERTALKAKNQDLRVELAGKQKDRALASKLTKLHAYGISDLLNRQPPQETNQDGIDEWRYREDKWQEDVLGTMYEHGCSDPEIHRVKMIGTFTFMPMHKNWDVSKDLSMLTVRLERIQEIINKYSD